MEQTPPPRPKPPPRPAPRVAHPQPAVHPAEPASVPATAPVAAPPTPAALPAVDPGWQNSVASWLASHKNYPDDARRRGDEGRVVIRFTVDRLGHVVDAEVVSSAGSSRLDDATLAMLRGAMLPAFPATMAQDRVTVTTSVRYTLR
jgi:protein TonB